jgi:hypothetical protein
LQPQPTTQQTTQPAQKQDDYVPLKTFLEEKQQRREMAEELRKSRERAEKMEQTFQQFLSKQNEVQAPKYEDDPLGTLKWENEQLKKQVEETASGVRRTEEEFTKARQMHSFAEHVQASESSFRQKAGDYDAAVQYLKKVRIDDFQDLGFNEGQAAQMLQNEIAAFAQAALQQGKNPAEVAYSMAKRYGYKGQDPEQELEKMQKGQDASKALGAGKSNAPLSLGALSELSNDQLDELIKDDKAWRKLGGR